MIFEGFRICCLAFPYNNYFPSFFTKFFFYKPITFNSFVEFILPELYPALGIIGKFAMWVSVPETAVDKYNRLIFR